MAYLESVYYHSLLCERLSSSLNNIFIEKLHTNNLWDPRVGALLKKELFSPKNQYTRDLLIEKVTDGKLKEDVWLERVFQIGRNRGKIY